MNGKRSPDFCEPLVLSKIGQSRGIGEFAELIRQRRETDQKLCEKLDIQLLVVNDFLIVHWVEFLELVV
jgi:hypothetical protein